MVLPSGKHYAASGQGAGVLKGISIAVAPSRMIELTSTGRVNGDFRPFLSTPPSFGGGDTLVTVAYAASSGGSMLAALLLPRVLDRTSITGTSTRAGRGRSHTDTRTGMRPSAIATATSSTCTTNTGRHEAVMALAGALQLKHGAELARNDDDKPIAALRSAGRRCRSERSRLRHEADDHTSAGHR